MLRPTPAISGTIQGSVSPARAPEAPQGAGGAPAGAGEAVGRGIWWCWGVTASCTSTECSPPSVPRSRFVRQRSLARGGTPEELQGVVSESPQLGLISGYLVSCKALGRPVQSAGHLQDPLRRKPRASSCPPWALCRSSVGTLQDSGMGSTCRSAGSRGKENP